MLDSTSFASVFFTYSETSFPFTPWPSATAKKWVLLYSPKWGSTKKLSWFVLFGFLGEYPVLVANANLVTQLSNFLLVYLGWTWCWEVDTSFEIEARTLFSMFGLPWLFYLDRELLAISASEFLCAFYREIFSYLWSSPPLVGTSGCSGSCLLMARTFLPDAEGYLRPPFLY